MTKVDTGIMDKSKSKGEKSQPNRGFLVPTKWIQTNSNEKIRKKRTTG